VGVTGKPAGIILLRPVDNKPSAVVRCFDEFWTAPIPNLSWVQSSLFSRAHTLPALVAFALVSSKISAFLLGFGFAFPRARSAATPTAGAPKRPGGVRFARPGQGAARARESEGEPMARPSPQVSGDATMMTWCGHQHMADVYRTRCGGLRATEVRSGPEWKARNLGS